MPYCEATWANTSRAGKHERKRWQSDCKNKNRVPLCAEQLVLFLLCVACLSSIDRAAKWLTNKGGIPWAAYSAMNTGTFPTRVTLNSVYQQEWDDNGYLLKFIADNYTLRHVNHSTAQIFQVTCTAQARLGKMFSLKLPPHRPPRPHIQCILFIYDSVLHCGVRWTIIKFYLQGVL